MKINFDTHEMVFSTGKKINDIFFYFDIESMKEELTIQEGIEVADYIINIWQEFKELNK
jgi:hypothetical protein